MAELYKRATIYRPGLIHRCSLHEFARSEGRSVDGYYRREFNLECDGTLEYSYVGRMTGERWSEETTDIDDSFAHFVRYACIYRNDEELPDAVVDYRVLVLRQAGVFRGPWYRASGTGLWRK
jgi:hypothetical protein